MPITDIEKIYPEGYDDESTTMGIPENYQVFTLNGGISVSGTTLIVNSGGDYTLNDLVLPCLLLFEGGEIWYIEDGDVISDTQLTINFSQRAQLGTSTQIHNDDEKVFTYFSGKQHGVLINILRSLEKFPVVQGLQTGTPTLIGEAYIDSNYEIYVSFDGTSFTKLINSKHSNLTDLPSGSSSKVHGSQYLNSVDGLSSWHNTQDGDHITGGDDHTHLVDASPIKRIAHGSSLPTGEKIGQIFLKDGELYMIYDDGLEFEPFFGIPSGSILPFPPSAGCPAGWTAYSNLNNDAYAKISAGGIGTVYGENTHTHTISEIPEHNHTILSGSATSASSGGHTHSASLYSSSGVMKGVLYKHQYSPTASVSGAHSHSGGTLEASQTNGLTSGSMVSSFESDNSSSEPPYATMMWCKKD